MALKRAIPTENSDPSKVTRLVCDHCGNEFLAYTSQLAKASKRYFCSHACKVDSQRRTDPTQADIEKFWSYVDVSRDPDACWEWNRARHPEGYGKVAWPGRKSPAIASRLAFELANGRPPVGLVRHSCDNPPCCNPAHLLDGTQTDNMGDAAQRGRTARGGRNGRALLAEDAIREIRRRYKRRHPVDGATALAREFGVSQAAISKIVSGKNWAHVSPES